MHHTNRMTGAMFGAGVRIGDAERTAAIEQLNQHYAAGRLTTTEHDERVDFALGARTQADLLVLFADLPSEAGTQRQHNRAVFVAPVLGTLILVAVISLAITSVVLLLKALPFLLMVFIAFLAVRTIARRRYRRRR